MAVIHLETSILAPCSRVFDLARSIDLHQATAEHTGERAVAGVTRGLLGLNEEVTWEARHLGVLQRLKVKMVGLEKPTHFKDVMLEGAFHSMTHDHFFEARGTGTIMIDHFEFYAPLGVLGRLAESLFLTSYMRRFLIQRNSILKQIAESERWKEFLS